MRLHENKDLLETAIRATAQQLNIPEVFVEKDYWVTVALHKVFHSPFGEQIVFKGGTALSKCHQIIERFSEDIDLVVLRIDGESPAQLSKKLKKISQVVAEVMPIIEIEGMSRKGGNFRKTGHEYKKLEGDNSFFGQVREYIVLESSLFGSHDPYTTETVSSYVADFIVKQNQLDLIKEYHLEAFSVKVLGKTRTLCEKIMSLVKFSFKDNPYQELSAKVRHIYDLHLLLKDDEVKLFFESPEFEKMMLRVGEDDRASYGLNKDWIYNHPSKAILFSEIELTWGQLKTAYHGGFKELVTGVLPLEKDILKTLKMISNRLDSIAWIEKK